VIAFASSVYEHVHAALGGSDGRTARGRFGNGMEYGDDGNAGMVQFVVTIVDGPNRGRSRRLRRNRHESDPATVAADLLNAYGELAKAF
jgi:hypothetical protein